MRRLVVPLRKALASTQAYSGGVAGPDVRTQPLPDLDAIYRSPPEKGMEEEQREGVENRMLVVRKKMRGFWGSPPRDPQIRYKVSNRKKKSRKLKARK